MYSFSTFPIIYNSVMLFTASEKCDWALDKNSFNVNTMIAKAKYSWRLCFAFKIGNWQFKFTEHLLCARYMSIVWYVISFSLCNNSMRQILLLPSSKTGNRLREVKQRRYKTSRVQVHVHLVPKPRFFLVVANWLKLASTRIFTSFF